MVSEREIISRWDLVKAYNKHGSYLVAAKEQGTDWRRVKRGVERWQLTCSVADKPRLGRPRKPLGSASAAKIIKKGLKAEKSAAQIAKQLQQEDPQLKAEGLHAITMPLHYTYFPLFPITSLHQATKVVVGRQIAL